MIKVLIDGIKYNIDEYHKNFTKFFFDNELIKTSGNINYVPKGKELHICAIIDAGDIPHEVVLDVLKRLIDFNCYKKIVSGLKQIIV